MTIASQLNERSKIQSPGQKGDTFAKKGSWFHFDTKRINESSEIQNTRITESYEIQNTRINESSEIQKYTKQ